MSLQAAARSSSASFATPVLAEVPSFSLQVVAHSALEASLENEISEFLDSQNTSHPFQFPQWSDGNSLFALVRQSGRISWYAHCGVQYPLSARVPIVRSLFVNRGPVCDRAELWRTGFHLLQGELAGRGFVHLDVAPDWVISETSENSRASLRLDLSHDEEQLFGGFRKNTRYEIRRAERLGVSIGEVQSQEHVSEFLALYHRMAERKNFAPDSLDHIRRIVNWLLNEPSRGTMLLARHDGALLGGVVIVRSGQRCWYLWGSTEKHADVNAGHALQWHALQWAKSHGCTEYDFGGYTVGAASGPAWFKQGFGGKVVHFAPRRRSILRPWYHFLLQRLSRA